MLKITNQQELMHLRRMALGFQGLSLKSSFGRGMSGALKAISHLGYIQIDCISVIERAHHHVLFNRVPHYHPDMLLKLLRKGDIFEYWSHAAAFLPMQDYRFSLPYKTAIKSGQTHWYKEPDHKLMAELLAKIQAEGPLRSRDIEANKKNRSGWWDWKPTKKALEQLYMEGDLMISDREGFQKTYDLTQRVLPEDVDTRMPTNQEFARHLLEKQLQAHGIVSLKGLTYLRRNPQLKTTMKKLIDEELEEGNLMVLQLKNGEVYYADHGLYEQSPPQLGSRLQILSPFDNSVIQRDRLKSLFDFDYQIECYVPQAKRRFGYFSLPLLFKGEFVGRMDCKAHRKDSILEVKSLHWEDHGFDKEEVYEALKQSLLKFCEFQGCENYKMSLS